MNRLTSLIAVLGALALHPAGAGTFTGSYTADGIFGQVFLDLEQLDDGSVSGVLNGGGLSFELVGFANEAMLEGEVLGQAIIFNASKSTDGILFSLTELNLLGVPAPDSTQVLDFVRIGDSDPEEEAAEPPKDGVVIINQITLNHSQLAELTGKYGSAPLPGNYWYDGVSGLYGAVGYPAYGFMFSGHRFGTLTRKASNGNTRVIVNNRELPQSEWAVWSHLLGYWIEPGNYWLDDQGNAGYVGVTTPVVNLYQAALQNSYGGQGASGENFWSTRFSAGNSTADNTQGYVSVPGHGPVGYGF